MRFIKTPHLPEGKVGLAAIGGVYRNRLETPLAARGLEVVWLPDNPGVDFRLRGHADLALIHVGGNKLVTVAAPLLVNILTNRGFNIINAENAQSADYPGDCGLNACIVGSAVLCNTALTDKAVSDALGKGARIIPASQGYTKCSVCVVDERSVITSDGGIAAATQSAGLDVLQIEAGHIRLDGFSFGFIGGASFKLSRSELAFTGCLDAHPDKDAILAFLGSRHIEPVFLTREKAFDIGSAVPLLEYNENSSAR